MAKTALVAAGLVLLAAGGGLAGYGATRKPTGGMTPEASSAMTSAIGQLDGDIRAAQADVKSATETLSTLQQVQSAVATNEASVQDMLTHGELAFSPKPGEVIELGQIVKSMQPTPLLIQPADAIRSLHAGKFGSYVELMGDKAVVTYVANVVPKDRKDQLSGYVMISRPLDLSRAFAKLEAAKIAGTFVLDEPGLSRRGSAAAGQRGVIDGKTRVLGTMSRGRDAQTTDMAPPSVPGAKIIVESPALVGGPQMPLIGGGGALAGVGLILLIVGLTRGKNQAPSGSLAVGTQPTHPVSAQQFGNAQTQISSSTHAVGTPAPIDTTAGFSSANLGAGSMIGRWEIIKRIGSGGMADVYLARARGEAGFEKLVAVKVMHPHLARNDRAVEHFLDEARLASRIDHPNVVQIQDLGKVGNDYIIVMEFVDGVDLEKLLASARAAQRQVPIDVALGILGRVCDGLNAAHNSTTVDGKPTNLVHRDVKSANVLVSKQGGVKVVDFGIAKATSQNHMTMAGETKGTPSMMAPEQRVGETVDVRADVYSVGAVAFEILTGHGVNLDLAALAHLGIENWPHLPLPSTLRPQLPVELDGLLMQCMSFDREKRPANCAALEISFDQIMKKYGLSASDKDIARWVSTEAAALVPSTTDATQPRV